MKKLSICIPTYNRSNLLISQLEFLKVEFLPFNESIEIIVADNCSSQEHRDKLIQYHSKNQFFNLKLNPTNLGSIGNIYYLLDNAKGEYVWFVSDDDVLLDGVLDRINAILSSHIDLLHIYLNYSAFSENPRLIDYTPNMLGNRGYHKVGKQALIDLFKENGTVSMFITSCIYSTISLKEYCKVRDKQTLIDPLLFSFVLANGPTYIESDVYVLERCTEFSWTNEALAIFSWQIQNGLIELLDQSYNKIEIIDLIKSLYISNKANYLRMLLQAPVQYKKLIVSFLGFRQIPLFFPSFLFNIKRVLIRLT